MCNDEYKYVSDRGYVIFDNKGNPVKMLGAIQDIDVRRKYEDQLISQNHKLKEIAWLNSHEIRRPLSNIMGLMPLIKPSFNDQESLNQLIDLMEISIKELDEAVMSINKESRS